MLADVGKYPKYTKTNYKITYLSSLDRGKRKKYKRAHVCPFKI